VSRILDVEEFSCLFFQTALHLGIKSTVLIVILITRIPTQDKMYWVSFSTESHIIFGIITNPYV
jgi:hypothetical protein